MLLEQHGINRYLAVSEAAEYIGKEVFSRDSTDWGDNTYWERGVLMGVTALEREAKKSKKAIWSVMVEGRVRRFDWCAVAE